MADSTQEQEPKQLELEISKDQHDMLVSLLGKQREIAQSITIVISTIAAGSKTKVPDGAVLAGTGTGTAKISRRTKYFAIFRA